MKNEMNLARKVAKYIVKTARTETTSGNWFVSFDEIFREFDIPEINDFFIKKVMSCVDLNVVSDIVVCDDGFDLDLYTDFCPNYDEN